MLRPEVIRRRLNNLDTYLSILEKQKQYSYEEFIENPERYGSSERFLHLAIESINDMANHIISTQNLGPIEWYSDLPMLFLKHNYIDSELKEEWIRMIGFRNTLVHEYVEIDRSIVFEVLQSKIPVFNKLRKVFAGFL
mgnify:CR=1 FL=1